MNKRSFALICYFVSILACLGAAAVSFLAFRNTITYTFGFLLFVPIWIIAYWFLGFFNALAREKDGRKTRFLIKKSLTRGLSTAANILSVLLLCFWVYAYIFMVLPASRADSKAKAGTQHAASWSAAGDKIN